LMLDILISVLRNLNFENSIPSMNGVARMHASVHMLRIYTRWWVLLNGIKEDFVKKRNNVLFLN
jgi:hypothetical protein